MYGLLKIVYGLLKLCMVYRKFVYGLLKKCVFGRPAGGPETWCRDKKSILGRYREGGSELRVDTYRRIHRIDLKQSKVASEKSCQCSENSCSI